MKKILGIILLLTSVIQATKIKVINKMPSTKASIELQHHKCGPQNYYFNPQSTQEFVPNTYHGGLFEGEVSCCVKKLRYKKDGNWIDLADENSLNEIGRKNGTGDNCTGYFVLEIQPNGEASVR